MKNNYPTDGVILINKPSGWKSFDVVKKIKYTTKVKKVGHGGSLDKSAKGLLIIFLGKATKLAPVSLEETKVYRATIKLGMSTDTDDPEGKIIKKADFNVSIGENISENKLKETLQQFVGEIEQVPPLYSAKKIKGKRASDLVRKGENISLSPKKVKIHYINYLGRKGKDSFIIELMTSKGAYVRALARDVGEKLGVYGYLYDLERLKIGNWNLENSITIEDFIKAYKKAPEQIIEKFSIKNFLNAMPELYIKASLISIIGKNKKLPASFIKNQNAISENYNFYALRDDSSGKLTFILKYIPEENNFLIVYKL